MSDWDLEKQAYDAVEIPEELHTMVSRTILYDRKKRRARMQIRVIRWAGSVAALLLMVLMIGVNSSYAFARAAVKIPVVGTVAKAMVVRNYDTEMAQDTELQESLAASEAVQYSEQAAEQATAAQPQQTTAVSDLSGNNPSPVQENDWGTSQTIAQLNEITTIYTPAMEKEYAGQPDQLKTILLAEITQDQVYLYGYHENGSVRGVILRVGDRLQFFDWVYMTADQELPMMAVQDIDGDGTKEILVTLDEKVHQDLSQAAQASGTAETQVSGTDAVPGTADSTAAGAAGSTTQAAEIVSDAGNTTADQPGNNTSAEITDQAAQSDPTAMTATTEESVSGNDAVTAKHAANVITVEELLKEKQLWIISVTDDAITAKQVQTGDSIIDQISDAVVDTMVGIQ